jgi:abhydrolase domain-containing protein 12
VNLPDSISFRSQGLKTPVLIAHADNDWDIPSTHSDTLFNALLEPFLPPLPVPPSTPGTWSAEDWSAFATQQSKRIKGREALVTQTKINNFGTLEEFQRPDASKVIILKTLRGGHNKVGMEEGVQSIIRRVFQFD